MPLTESEIARIVDQEINHDWRAFTRQIGDETYYSSRLKTSLTRGIAKAITAAIEASKGD